ncbi:hypothetical protein [Pseudoduganella sp.]|uniref:hypothetical protein n=1 Tax=Pseudoduganella sp. TaxID=1880898 RepID=UPI0035AEC6A1
MKLYLGLISLALAGCTSMRASTPPAPQLLRDGVVLERSLPAELPAESTPFPGSQMVLVSTDSAAGLLVPVPFVTDVVMSAVHKQDARSLGASLKALDPYQTMAKAMGGSAMLSADGKGVALRPLAYLVDCSDAQYRLAMVARIDTPQWMGRYMTHLSTTLPRSALHGEDPALAGKLQTEMGQAASILRSMLERDARGELSAVLYRADVGSYHLACSTISGVLSPKLMLARNAEVVEDAADHIIVRVMGDPSHSGPTGGLLYGMHYLRKDQLHTLERKAP